MLRLRNVVLALACGVLVKGVALAEGSSAGSGLAPSASRWQPLAAPPGPLLALAPGPSGWLAVADARGVLRGRVGQGPASGRAGFERIHRARGIEDLAFDAEGRLWVASGEGLHRIDPGAVAAERRAGLAGGVRRIAGAGGLWFAASDDGVRMLAGDGSWVRLRGGLPAGAASALAVGRSAAGLRIGAVIEGVAHWGTLAVGDSGAAPAGAAAPTLALDPGPVRGDAVDVWLPAGSGEGWTLLRNGCLRGPRPACVALPPGSEAQRLFAADARYWLATGRGLLSAPDPGGPWRPEPPPLASLAVQGLATAGDGIYVATERGLHVAAASAAGAEPEPGSQKDRPPPSAPKASLPAVAGSLMDLPPRLRGENAEPGMEEVRRAALAYLDLGPHRLGRLQRAPGRRGWLPTVALRFERDRTSEGSSDWDEAWLSGARRSLFDRERQRSRGFEASLALTWDLGDIVYHPESVDVSREVRELVELRDDVLDELRHLYFERRRVLLELLVLPADRPVEAARLRLRADELAAGIDAWTGGWFGRRAVRAAPGTNLAPWVPEVDRR